MTCHDSLAHRFAKTWLGPSLATLVGIAGSLELAAMPIPVTGAQLLGPTLIQQSPGPQGDAPQPAGKGKLDAFLQEALTAARERLEKQRGELMLLSRAAEAVAAIEQLEQELAALREENQKLAALREENQKLAALREENQKLRAELDVARTERGELETTKQAAEARAAELTKTVEQATAKARQTDQELVAVRSQSEQRIAAADSARTEAEARLSEMRDRLQRAGQEKARIGADLDRVQGELATAKKQVATAGQERARIGQRAAALEDERDDLRTRLADATARLRRLIAVENRIKELTKVLAAIGSSGGPLETDAALPAELGTPSAGEQAVVEGRAAAAPAENLAPPSQGPEPGSADADLQRTKTASATRPGEGEGAHLDQRGILGGVPPVLTLADVPLERRQHVQGLLADLRSKLDERGLMTTVPGELLFAVGRDEVQAGAYDTLAKVAELIGMYPNRQVLIVGHSDAIGDAEQNRQLSERRAEVVKQILVENFELAADRLSTEGVGEARPIASNATPQGRRANRRVEVLILN
jgi:chemotaxis protein MotB